MRVKLTDRFVGGVKAPAGIVQADFFDATARGLCLRVSNSGRKSWTYLFSAPGDGRRIRIGLGTYPAISLGAARALAVEARGHVEEGKDPRSEMEGQRAGAMTVAGLVESYLEKHVRPNLRSAAALERRLRKNVVPIIGMMELGRIHRRDVHRCVDPVLARGSRGEAGKVFADLSALFAWAVSRGYVDHHPMLGLTKPEGSAPRERVLSDTELRTLWNVLPEALPRSPAVQRILRLCLITGQRSAEIAGIRLPEIDRKRQLWTIPASRVKNKHVHSVALSDFALTVIDEALVDADAEFLFPGLTSLAVAQAVGHAQERFGIDHFVTHDLRRTAISNMQRLGIQPIVAARIANHRSVFARGVTLGIYGRYGYESEARQALDLWAARLADIIAGDAEKVMPMVRPKAS